MNRSLLCLIFALLFLPAAPQSVYPGLFPDKVKVPSVAPAAVCVDPAKVALLPSRFRDNMKRDSAWMASIAVDRLLHSFYNNSGVYGGKEGGYMTVKKYGGWESLDCELRGHTTGHLMSALALIYANTGDPLFKAKGDSIVDGLEKVQQALGNGYLSAFPEEFINRNIRGEAVWAPWYTLHKILSGLIDQYLYAGNEKALRLAEGMGGWAADKLKDIDAETRARMLRNEFGGINEAFYNLYSITGNPSFRELAEFFYHNEVIDPLKERDADFGTKHTNTFIPKVIGEARRYELTGEEESLALAHFFWNEMMSHHVFAPGCLSDKEHFFPTYEFSRHISGYTGETCVTYNMLKLGRHLFCANPDASIFDYYERALYNHILGQQDPESGMVAYFLPLLSGSHRVYSTPENSFWCCVGSGFENHAKYAESIYFLSPDSKSLYVNLFIPSEINWEATGLKIRQENDFPSSPSTKLTISGNSPAKASLRLRHPAWADNMSVKVNGRKVSVQKGKDGYVTLNRKWADGDVVEIDFGMTLSLEPTPDDPSRAALLYGPIVLAGRLGTDGMLPPAPQSDPSLYNDYYTYDYHIPEGLPTHLDLKSLKQTGPLSWQTADGVTVEPLSDIHRERYVVYWNL